MKRLTIIFFISFITFTSAQIKERELKIVSFSGDGYELGLQHGRILKAEIEDIIKKWKENTSKVLGKDADLIIDDFFDYANFEESIKEWTPNLFKEVEGIADGSSQSLRDILVLNLLDEFWVYIDDIHNHHCSGIGVPAKNGNPAYISQNMDLESYTDGFQVLMKLDKTYDKPKRLILTHPGLIALNGLNEKRVGVCVNTILQLSSSSKGLPVAFVIRRIIDSTSKNEILHFINSVNHASGQNYIIGLGDEVYDFEASANKVVRFVPKNKNKSVYHTNHPIVNDDVKPHFEKYNPTNKDKSKIINSNSYKRLVAIKNRVISNDDIDHLTLKKALRSKDDINNPVCVSNDGNGFTFASVIMTLSSNPYIKISAGPPNETNYIKLGFKEDN